jgi:hypothetical protein
MMVCNRDGFGRVNRRVWGRLGGVRMGRNPLVLDNLAIQHDRQNGQSSRQIAKGHRISTATVQRVLKNESGQGSLNHA